MEFHGKRRAPKTFEELEEARLLAEVRAFEEGVDPEPIVPDENTVVPDIHDDETEED